MSQRAPGAFALLLSPLLLTPGVGQADDPEPLCIVFITPASGFSQVEIAIDLILNESDVARIMGEVDSNQDLSMDSAEVRHWEVNNANRITWTTPEEFNRLGDKKLLLDEQMPQWIDVNLDLKKFEGPVDSKRNVTVTEVRTYPFYNYPGPYGSDVPSHTLVGGEKAKWAPKPVVETAIISAPQGWWVWSVNGTGIRQTSVTIKGFDYKGLFTIVYAKDGHTPEGRPVGWEMQILMYTVIALVAVAAIGAAVFTVARKKERREGAPKEAGQPVESGAAVASVTSGRKG